MGVRSTQFAEDEYYHVYNRGVDKRVIFKNNSDYQRFQELLFLSNTSGSINVRDIKKRHSVVYDYDRLEELVAIGAYCLMPNHFHILLTPLVDNGVQIFMQRLATSYSMYFNRRYERTGALFEGRFKAKHADEDEYLKYLFAYIHLNPVKLMQSDWRESGIQDIAGAFTYLQSYHYSSLVDYMGSKRPENGILLPAQFPEYFVTAHDHKSELVEWLLFDEEEETTETRGPA